MKTIKCIFLCSVLSLLSFSSCLENVGNSQTFSADNAVVRYSSHSPGVTLLDTPYGRVAAPELNSKNYKDGDCLLASFMVDYDNQPKQSAYLAVSSVQAEKLGKTNIIMLDSETQSISKEIDDMSVDSISDVRFLGYSGAYCIDNNLFMGFFQPDAKTRSYDYQLVYSDSFIDKIPVLYVCAKDSSVSSAIPYGDYRIQAIDISRFLDLYPNSENQITFYLKYKSGVDNKNENIYKLYSKEPITVVNYLYTED